MKKPPAPPLTLLQYFRFGIQLSALMVNIYAGFKIAYTAGLPDWAFTGAIIIAGLFFCSWYCPFGTIQEQLRNFGRLLKLNLMLPEKLDRVLLWFRYIPGLLLPVYVWNIFNAQETFYRLFPLSKTNGAGMIFLAAMLLFCLALERPFCRYLCPYGAMRSLWQLLRIFSIRRDEKVCINCKKCDQVCPMGIKVSAAEKLRNIRCINCMKCLSGCPARGALKFGIAIPGSSDLKRQTAFIRRTPSDKK